MTNPTDHLHQQFDLDANDVVEVIIDGPANVHLLDDNNYQKYQRGEKFRYYGGYIRKSPVRLKAPRAGRWHVVVDLGGGFGSVRALVKIYPADLAQTTI